MKFAAYVVLLVLMSLLAFGQFEPMRTSWTCPLDGAMMTPSKCFNEVGVSGLVCTWSHTATYSDSDPGFGPRNYVTVHTMQPGPMPVGTPPPMCTPAHSAGPVCCDCAWPVSVSWKCSTPDGADCGGT